MTKMARRDLAAMIEGDPLRIVLEFLSRAHELRFVSKAFALYVLCDVDVSSSPDFPQVPSRVTSLVCRGRQATLPLTFYPGVARIGRDLMRLDLRQMVIASFDFLDVCWALKELFLQGSIVQSGGVINCSTLQVLDMGDTEFRLGSVPNLQDLTIRECPNSQVLPPSLTSLDCSYTRAPLWLSGLQLTQLDMSGLSLKSLKLLRNMPLKVLFLTSCTLQDFMGDPWLLDAALLPHCVKLSVSNSTIYPKGTFPKLEVFEMQQCPNIEYVPDAPFLTTLNCSDNYLTEEFIEGLKGLPMLTELNAAGCNELEDLDFSGLDLKYLAVPDTRVFGEPPSYGFPNKLHVVRFSEQDLEEFDERVLGLPDHILVYIHSFDVHDYEDPEESGLERAWETVSTVTLQELRDQAAF